MPPSRSIDRTQNKDSPQYLEKGYVVKADTIEELAQKLGLSVDALKATVARNNELYKKGEVRKSIVSFL